MNPVQVPAQDDLDHLAFPTGNPMARHMLYRFKNR
jgi:hypothetical protein